MWQGCDRGEAAGRVREGAGSLVAAKGGDRGCSWAEVRALELRGRGAHRRVRQGAVACTEKGALGALGAPGTAAGRG